MVSMHACSKTRTSAAAVWIDSHNNIRFDYCVLPEYRFCITWNVSAPTISWLEDADVSLG